MATMPPKLEVLDTTQGHTFIRPAKRINEGVQVSHFTTTKAYRDIGIFITQLNRSLIPRKAQKKEEEQPSKDNASVASATETASATTAPAPSIKDEAETKPVPPLAPPRTIIPPLGLPRKAASTAGIKTYSLTSDRDGDPAPIKNLRELLKKVEALKEDAPPETGPRRFGNVAFRKWYALVEGRIEDLLREYVPVEGMETKKLEETEEGDQAAGPLDEIKAYFLGGFGSHQRLDYGTGHELSFLAFLGCLWKLGVFTGFEGGEPYDIERRIVLGVFEPYLSVVRSLILTYNLEPAGSHGVWGLDDHSSLPYIFGSAQLSRPLESESDPTPLEGSVPGAPKPSDVVNPKSVEKHRTTNMYFSAIGFINDVKKGPFWEHSPILYDVSGIKDGWGKINKGMILMYNAEVLNKFPVVQHFPFGSLFSWEQDPEAAKFPAGAKSVHLASQPGAAASGGVTGGAGGPGGMPKPGPGVGTAAPWATSTAAPGAVPGGLPRPGPGVGTAAPWATGVAPGGVGRVPGPGSGVGTAAPWATGGAAPKRMPIPGPGAATAAPWAAGSTATGAAPGAGTAAPWAKQQQPST